MSSDFPLPDGWTWETIDSIKASGRSIVSGPFGSNIGKRFFVEHGVPVIRGNNLSLEMEQFKDDGFVFLTEEKAAEFANCEAHPEDLIFTAAGTIGQVGIIPKAPKFPKYIISNKQLRARLDRTKVRPLFAYYWLASPPMVATIQGRNTGSTIPLINLSVLKSLAVPLPPLVVQDGIVSILMALDDRITLLRETNATLEAIAQALFKSWFVDFDPVRAKAEGRQPEGMDAPTAALFPDSFEETEQGLVPKGWEMSTLGAVCEANGGMIQTGPFGSQLHASDYVAGGVPVVMPKDIFNRRVNANTAARIGREDAQRLARHQLRDGDIVFSRRGDVEKHALIGEAEIGWLCGTGCLLVRSGSRRNVAGFLSRSLDLPHIKTWLTQHAVGATMPNLNTGILSAVPVVLPSDEVLAAFDETTIALDRRISANNAAAQTLTQLRDTLLPRLISGQLRLPEAGALIEESI